jgi:hypothetical protein
MRLYEMQNDLAYLGDTTASLRDQAKQRSAAAAVGQLKAQLDEYAKAVDALNETLVDRSGGLLEADPRLREKAIDVYSSAMAYGGRPSASQTEYVQALAAELAKAQAAFKELSGTRLQTVNDALTKAGQKPITAGSSRGEP